MQLLGNEVERMGMGCWAIGGPFYEGEQALGYGATDDKQSIATVHAALEMGLRLFDTAGVYGAGHSERLLGQALKGRSDTVLISKLGLSFDEQSKQMHGVDAEPKNVLLAIEKSLRRLQRDRIDIMLLHLNTLSVAEAAPLFEQMQRAMEAGKIGAYGWSTDFPCSVDVVASQSGFVAVEHAMNVFHDVPAMNQTIAQNELISLIRSPLAMGVLTGKFGPSVKVGADDIRAGKNNRTPYFVDSQVVSDYTKSLDAVRELLQHGGRSVAQGALCWLLAQSARAIPLPGARSVEQVRENAGALAFGPLPPSIMAEIEGVVARQPDAEPIEL